MANIVPSRGRQLPADLPREADNVALLVAQLSQVGQFVGLFAVQQFVESR